MNIFIKILKILGLLVLAGVLIIGAIVGYQYYEEEKKKAEELSYATAVEWQWHNEYQRTQIKTTDRKSVLRKAYPNKKYMILAYKNDDYSMSALVYFVVDCEPGSEIITTSSFSDGKPKKLVCDDSGNGFSLSVTLEGKDSDRVWKEDLGGFNFRENFGNWDFTKLDQEITLSKAKQKTEKKEKEE